MRRPQPSGGDPRGRWSWGHQWHPSAWPYAGEYRPFLPGRDTSAINSLFNAPRPGPGKPRPMHIPHLLALRRQLLKKAEFSSCCPVLSAPTLRPQPSRSPRRVAEPVASLGTGAEARQGGASSVLVLALLPGPAVAAGCSCHSAAGAGGARRMGRGLSSLAALAAVGTPLSPAGS